MTRLPRDVQEAVARVVVMSRNNHRATLNVCFPYTAQDEIAAATRQLAIGVRDGLIRAEDVDDALLELCLYTRHCPEPDLLIRTSGEVRLSDFLLWQSAYSHLCFMDVLWPEFTWYHLAAAILAYQRKQPHMAAYRIASAATRSQRGAVAADAERARRVEAFLHTIYAECDVLFERLFVSAPLGAGDVPAYAPSSSSAHEAASATSDDSYVAKVR